MFEKGDIIKQLCILLFGIFLSCISVNERKAPRILNEAGRLQIRFGIMIIIVRLSGKIHYIDVDREKQSGYATGI